MQFARFLLITSLIFVGILGCSLIPVSKDKPVYVAFSAYRYLETEPCGCEVAERGGLRFEKQMLSERRISSGGNLITIAGGNSLVSDLKISQSELSKRGLAMWEAMKELDFDFYALLDKDLSQSPEFFATLSKDSIPMLSTNVVPNSGTNPFATFIRLKKGGKEFVFLSVVDRSKDTRYRVEPYETAIEQTLKRIEFTSDTTVVLISALSPSQRDATLKRFPKIRVHLGGIEDDMTWQGEWAGNGKQLHAQSRFRGRGFVWATFGEQGLHAELVDVIPSGAK